MDQYITDKCILHYLAKKHELNLLFYFLCLGYDQTYVDIHGKNFINYLYKWEYDMLLLLYKAWISHKIFINIYKDYHSTYMANHYMSNGNPILPLIWKHNFNVKDLERILDSGSVDLDNVYLSKCEISEDPYKEIMMKYGFIPYKKDNRLYNYYLKELWTDEQINKKFDIKPINPEVKNILGIKVIIISDTHWNHNKLKLPDGDILICAGDICMPWHNNLLDYIIWMSKQKHSFKILIAGNHDKIIQNNKSLYMNLFKKYDIIYLEDSGFEINGIKFWGTPWTPKRLNNKNDAFTLKRKDLIHKWNLIPFDTNVLISHCPPYGVGDNNTKLYKTLPYQSGDYGLKKTISRLENLKLHIFGHQHFGRGVYKGTNNVVFINASLNENHNHYCIT